MEKLINISEADQPLVNRHNYFTQQLNEGANPEYAKRPGQGDAWFQSPSKRRKGADGETFSHSEYTGQLYSKCPACHTNSLHWVNIEKQTRGKYELLSLRTKPMDVEARFRKTGSKGATEEAQVEPQEARTDQPRREPKTHEPYDPTKTVGVEDRTTIDGQPNSEELREELAKNEE